MDTVSTSGQTEVSTKEPGTPTKSQTTVNTPGTTAELIRATGSTTTCTARESTNGPMAENTKVIMLMIRNTVMEFTLIQMDDLTRANGKTASNMEKEFSSRLKALRDKVSGTKVKESNGWMKMKSKNKKCKYNENYLILLKN